MTNTRQIQPEMMNKFFLSILAFLMLSFAVNAQEEEEKDLGSPLVQSVMQQLDLKPEDCWMNMVDEQMLSYDDNLIAVVIPKVISEEEYIITLDAVVVVADGETGKIIARFYDENVLISDHIRLNSIDLTLEHDVSGEDVYVFGVQTFYFAGYKRAFSHSEKHLSLFAMQEDTLHRVLTDFQLSRSYSDWDGICPSNDDITENQLIIVGEQTNGFYNIIVDKTITTTVNYPIADTEYEGEEEETICEGEETTENSTFTLVYINGEYQIKTDE